MSSIVLDASVTVSWLLEDEMDPRAVLASERVVRDGALVPQLWHLEVRNALVAAERRGRTSADALDERMRVLRSLPVMTDMEPDLDAVSTIARVHGLSIYDAVYVELARRHDTAVATLDDRLGQAAVAEGLSLVE